MATYCECCAEMPKFSGAPGKSPDTRGDGDPRLTFRPVPSPSAPGERVAMLVPVRRRLFNRLGDLLPGLEPPALQRQRLQHLPPRLDRVEIGRVHRPEDELPPGYAGANRSTSNARC